MSDYHSDTSRVSKTMLNLYCDSPVEYDLTYNKKTLAQKRATTQMNVGTILHAVFLERKDLEDVAVEYPSECFKSNGSLNPKPAAEFRKSIWPKLALKSSELESCRQCMAEVLSSPLRQIMLEATEFERPHFAQVYGLECKCKPDLLVETEDRLIVGDLKFCDPSRGAFIRSAKRFRYWLQDAHYTAVLATESDKPIDFRFFAIEPEFPNRVQCYWYGQREREIARDYHKRKVEELLESLRTGVWRDDWRSELPLSPWDIGEFTHEEDPELVGFEDE